MRNLRYILALSLSALISLQALAGVAMPCFTSVEGGGSMVADMDDTSLHAHHGATDGGDTTDSDAGNCCDAGYCSQGGCLSLAAAASDRLISAVEPAHAPTPAIQFSTPQHSPTTLYRPPSA